MSLNWLADEAMEINHSSRKNVIQSQAALTHPPGQLGIMQQISADFAGWQGRSAPICVDVVLLAASILPNSAPLSENCFTDHQSHGSAQQPSLRTAASLARRFNADLVITPVSRPEAAFCEELFDPDSDNSAHRGMLVRQSIERGYWLTKNDPKHLMVLTTSGQESMASARSLYRAILGQHSLEQSGASHLLRMITSYEVAAFLGGLIGAAQAGMPVLISGFVATAVALLAVTINPSVRSWIMFTHQGDSPEQRRAISRLGAQPLLQGDSMSTENHLVITAIDVVRSSLGLQQRAQHHSHISALSH